MKGIFHYDGWLAQALSKITDALFLGLLWLVFSLPIITIGASSTALYYTVHKVLRKNNGTVWAEFWKAFKSCFKQSTVLFLVMAIVGVIVFYSLYYGYMMYLLGKLEGLFMIFLCAINLLILSWLSYVFPYAARFNAPTGEILKNCAAIAFINILPSVALVAVWLITWFLTLNIPLMLLVMPVIGTWLTSSILERIFRKYMTEEALAAEAVVEGNVEKSEEG